MKNLTELLQENKTDPNKNSKWNFNLKFIQQIARKTECIDYGEYSVSCEEIDTVLLVLFELTES